MTKNSTSFKSGKDHPNYKSGSYINNYGYKMILNPEETSGYIAEHVYLAQKRMGRKLFKDEVVHHIDHNKLNNELENLCVTTRSVHSRIHATGRKFKKETIEKLKFIRSSRVSGIAHEQWNQSYTLDDIILLLEVGFSKKQAAKHLGIHKDTLRNRAIIYTRLINKHFKGVKDEL